MQQKNINKLKNKNKAQSKKTMRIHNKQNQRNEKIKINDVQAKQAQPQRKKLITMRKQSKRTHKKKNPKNKRKN